MEKETCLWKCSLQLLSLALVIPQYEVHVNDLCQEMGIGKGRREGVYPVLLKQFILKYIDVAVLVQSFLIYRKPWM